MDDCPEAYAKWMKHGCLWKDNPVDDDFGINLWVWWTMLKNSEDDFSVTRTNGILLIVLGLAWWGSHITEEIHQNPEPHS